MYSPFVVSLLASNAAPILSFKENLLSKICGFLLLTQENEGDAVSINDAAEWLLSAADANETPVQDDDANPTPKKRGRPRKDSLSPMSRQTRDRRFDPLDKLIKAEKGI